MAHLYDGGTGEMTYAPCPTCKQYSHSLGEDQIADAFNHFQSMISHRGDGIATQYAFDGKTRDAAQVLVAHVERLRAALKRYGQHDQPNDGLGGCRGVWPFDKSPCTCGLIAALESSR
jgi:hypothetical protein